MRDDEEERPIQKRKADHIQIALNREVTGRGITTGMERYRFRHEALPEIDFSRVSLSTSFLGRPLKAPFLISSMTGGTEQAGRINAALAEAAQERGWAMGLGSVRVAIEHPETAATFPGAPRRPGHPPPGQSGGGPAQLRLRSRSNASGPWN